MKLLSILLSLAIFSIIIVSVALIILTKILLILHIALIIIPCWKYIISNMIGIYKSIKIITFIFIDSIDNGIV